MSAWTPLSTGSMAPGCRPRLKSGRTYTAITSRSSGLRHRASAHRKAGKRPEFRTVASNEAFRRTEFCSADVSEAKTRTRDEELGRFDVGLVRGRGLEGMPEHVLDAAREVERHRFAHALRDVIDVLLVALRQDDLSQAHPVRGQHF